MYYWLSLRNPPPFNQTTNPLLLKVLFNAQNWKILPDKIENPFNQKLFNKVLSSWEIKKVGFSLEECSPRMNNKKTGEATQLGYDVTDILWRIKMAEGALKNRTLWSKVPSQIQSLLAFENKSKKEPVVVTQASTHQSCQLYPLVPQAASHWGKGGIYLQC